MGERSLVVLFAALVGVALIGAVAMGGMVGGFGMGPGMMYGYGSQLPALGGWGAGIAMGLGWLMMLAFWGAIIVGIALLVRGIWGRPGSETADQNPLTILQRRYAAGEIDQQTYERMRRELRSADGGEPVGLHRAS